MKLTVNTPLKGKEITALLEEYKEGEVSFKFLAKTGLQYAFDVSGIEKDAACDLAKKLIKETEYGKVLYFSVSAE